MGADAKRGALVAVLATAGATMVAPQVALAQTSPSDFTSATRYDPQRRIVGTIAADPDGAGPLHYAATRTTYDTTGNLIRVEKGELASWQSEAVAPSAWTGFTVFSKVETSYDILHRKTVDAVWGWNSATSAWVESGVTQYSYDQVGRQECTAVRMNPATWSALPASACTLATTSSTYGPDRITKNVYDAAAQLLRVIRAYGVTTANGLPQLQQDYVTYSYTPDGKQKTVKDANGNVATYTYDGYDRLIAWAFPSKTVVGSSAACTVGTVAEATDGFGNTVAGPSETRTAGDDCEKYAYDRSGNRAKLMKRDGNVIRYAYDALDRNTIKDIPGGTASDVYFGYDLRGLQTFARFVSAGGVGITNSFDGFGRLTSTTNNMGTTARTLSYTYDADGNRSQLTYPDASFFTYVYDGLDRLTTIKEAGTTAIVSTVYNPQQTVASQTRGAVTTTLGYDPVSRPSSWTDDLAGTTSDVTSTFAYNPASQRVTKTRSNNAYAFTGYVSVSRPYGVNGQNQYTTAGAATFTYDDNGDLTGDGTNSYGYDVENRMTSATIAGVGVIPFKYDPLGRLWQEVLPAKTWEYTHDGDAIVMAANASATWTYVHGPGEDDPMIQYTGGARSSLQTDYQGSIVSLADATGAKTNINTYDEYGISPTTNAGLFGYTGQLWLVQAGLYYYKARMYSPTLGRFMQTDPIGYKDQVNLYAYVGNDPIDARDPTGTLSRGFGFSDDEWKRFDQKQQQAARDMNRTADRLTDKASKATGAKAERLTTEAANLRAGAAALSDTSSSAPSANLMERGDYLATRASEYGPLKPGQSGSAAFTSKSGGAVFFSRGSNGIMDSNSPASAQWQIGHESLHTFRVGLHDVVGSNKATAYRYGDQANEDSYNEFKGKPKEAQNPDNLMGLVYP